MHRRLGEKSQSAIPHISMLLWADAIPHVCLKKDTFVPTGLGCALGKQAGQITFGNMLGVLWCDQKNRPEMVSTVVQEAGVTHFTVWFVP